MSHTVQSGTRAAPALLAFLLLTLSAATSAQSGGAPAAGAPAPSAATPPVPAAEPALPPLPPGIEQVLFGTAVRDRSATGVPRCAIPQPLPAPPRFEPGTTEIAYTIRVDPQAVKAVKAKVVGDLGCPEPWTQGCVGYTICGGGVCQNQFGATVSCPGEKPLKKGSYKLVLTVGDQTLELPFEIE